MRGISFYHITAQTNYLVWYENFGSHKSNFETVVDNLEVLIDCKIFYNRYKNTLSQNFAIAFENSEKQSNFVKTHEKQEQIFVFPRLFSPRWKDYFESGFFRSVLGLATNRIEKMRKQQRLSRI